MEKNNKNRSSNTDDSHLEKMINARFDREKKAAWADKLAKEHGVVRKSSDAAYRPLKVRSLFATLSAVAAVALLLIIAIPMLTPPTSLEMADNYLTNEKLAYSAKRKNIEDLANQRSAAGEAYELNDYSEAIELWEEIINTSNQANAGDHFFLGLSYLHNEQPELAVESLLKAGPLSEQEDNSYTQDINWFLSLAYVKAGQLEQARNQLESIQANEWNYELAQKILKRLEK